MTGIGFQTTEVDRLISSGRILLPGTLNDGLDFVHMLTDGLALSLLNLAGGGSPATVTGAPTVNNGYLSLTGGSKFLTTATQDRVAQTFMVSGRLTSVGTGIASRIVFAGNFSGSNGTSFYVGSTGLFGAAYYQTAPASGAFAIRTTPAAPIVGVNDWLCAIVSFDDAGIDVYNMTNGTTSNYNASTQGGRSLTANNVTIGSRNTLTGNGDVIRAMGWNRRLTADERAAAYAFDKELGTDFSISL